MLFDTHTHFDDEKFNEDRFEMINKAHDSGVDLILNAAADIESSRAGVLLGKEFDFIYSSVGFHPSVAKDVTEEMFKEIETLAKNPKVVAIGEAGLDYYYDDSPRDIQKEIFRRQIELAKSLKLPIIVHDRDAHEDTLNILNEENAKECGGVLHCFSGSVEMAKIVLNMGLYISVGGVVTFKNAKKLVEVVKYVPMDRLLLETDAPYLTPEPYRGKRNYSGYVGLVAEKVAELKGLSYDDVTAKTFENGKRFFKLK